MHVLGKNTLAAGLFRLVPLTAVIACMGCFEGVESSVEEAAAEERVISLSRAASEVVIGLGAASWLIAVDAESARLPELEGVAIVRPEEVVALDPDLVIVPTSETGGPDLAQTLRAAGLDVLEFAPHDFDDAAEFCWALGVRLQRVDEAHAFARESTRHLALLSSQGFGIRRPRIAVLLGFDPLTLAGGHSFLTDLVEAAGAENVMHGTEAEQIEMSIETLFSLQPEWLVLVSPRKISSDQRDRLRVKFEAFGPLEYLVAQPERLWLHDAHDVALRIRALVCDRAGGDESAAAHPGCDLR